MQDTNGNIKASTVAAVLTAVLLTVGVVLFVWRMDAARCAEMAEVDSRVRQQEVGMRYMQQTLDEIRADVKVIKTRTTTP